MKAKAIFSGSMFSILTSATPVLAAEAVREDHSGIVVWIFLGFCALIVVAQLVPAVLLMTGVIKAVVEPRKEASEQVNE